jgi:hypothetical protein
MAILDRNLVSRYIESGQVFAASETEKKMVRLALELNSPRGHRARPGRTMYSRRKFKSAKSARGYSIKKSGKFIGEIFASAEKADETSRNWQRLIRKEIHLALCTRSTRYRKYVENLSHNVHLLIGAIAVSVAGKLGLAVTVVAALVASLLRLSVSMGVAVFCKKFADNQL